MDSRRGGARRGTTLLPLRSRTRHHPHSISCWYCDVKFFSLNEPLYRFGRRYSRYFRVWFSMGIGFSLAALVGVTLLILCELFGALLVYSGNGSPSYSLSWLSSLLTGPDFSLVSIGYLCVSTVICVLVHEFGHALAAASEGIQMEYLAVFLAVLFPGALVAFDNALLQALSRVASLRIYCAGVWHNAAFCAVCIFALLLLPVMLNPFYIYGESPMVLDVSSSSPLSGYLSPRDVIMSLGDIPIHSKEDWKMAIAMLTAQTHTLTPHQADGMLNANKGYCVPHSLIERSIAVDFMGNQTSCPNELSAFASVSCGDSSNYDGDGRGDGSQKQHIHCLDAKDIVKLTRCVNSSLQVATNGSVCLCSEVESCLIPLQLPGQGWVEIKYSTPDCRSSLSNYKDSSNLERSCFQTFVFVGDLISMGNSIHLTSYQPRWSINFASYLPSQLESFLTCLFHVSLVLALLNSLPVFCLDGESILEATIDSFSSMSSRKKGLVLRICLLGGTLISVCFILLTLFLSRRPMEALVCRELGDPNTALTLSRDHPIPQLESPTDVRIRVKANSLNFLTYLQVQGKYQEKPPLPFIPGSDFSGIVDAVGSQVTKFRIGDPVISHSDVSSFAQFIVTDESDVFMVPEGCDLVAASALPIAYRTSHLALIHRAQLRLGQVLLVLGAAGGVGVSAVQIGKLRGAIVIAVARGNEKVQFLKSLNVDHVVDLGKENIGESVKAFLKARNLKGIDVLYDPVGGKLTKESLKLLNWGAQILVIGFASGEVPVIPANIALVKNWTVHGLYLGGYKTVDPCVLEDSLKELLSWLASGFITVHVSHTFSFSEIHLAFAALKDRKAIGKVVIVPDDQRFARPML